LGSAEIIIADKDFGKSNVDATVTDRPRILTFAARVSYISEIVSIILLAVREEPGIVVHCEKYFQRARAFVWAGLCATSCPEMRFKHLLFETLLGSGADAEACDTGRGHE
jgi:hypothetical protein